MSSTTAQMWLVPIGKREARKRYSAGERIGATTSRYPNGLPGNGFTREELGWSFDEVVDNSGSGTVYWFRPENDQSVKRTAQLEPGDVVSLPAVGVTRVIESVTRCDYVCNNGEFGYTVRYVPGSGTGEWSGSNGSSYSGIWQMA